MSYSTPEYVEAMWQERLAEAERHRMANQLPRPRITRHWLRAALRRRLLGQRHRWQQPPVDLLRAKAAGAAVDGPPIHSGTPALPGRQRRVSGSGIVEVEGWDALAK